MCRWSRVPLLLFAVACASDGLPEVLPEGPPTSRAAPAAPSAAPSSAPPAAPAGAPAQAPAADLVVRVLAIGPASAEDGEGGVIAAPQAVAIELIARGWPGRALDPSLTIQGRRFTRYTHPNPTTLRFELATPDLAPAGATAFLRYGDEPAAEVVLPAIEAP